MTAKRYTFRRADRLSGAKTFAAVFDAKVAKTAGPLRVFGRPNGLDHHRLGLTVSAGVGNAVQRHRIKRLLREAFRLSRCDWPGAYDIVVVVRPHAPASLDDYRRLLTEAVGRIDLQWRQRSDPS